MSKRIFLSRIIGGVGGSSPCEFFSPIVPVIRSKLRFSEVEFWAGKPSRLHDRVRYRRREGSSTDSPGWTTERLSP